jgi:hypothetical protein
MDKKDIYEHLAKIYLDASLKRKKIGKEHPIFKNLFFISITVIVGLTVLLLATRIRNKLLNSELALALQPDVVKINFSFDHAKKELYTINLNGLNLSKYKVLGFAVKRADYKDSISLRVEFNSLFKEKSEMYFVDIPHKWREYRVKLSEFKNIKDWSEMAGLSFIIEAWNVREKKGVVYLDNVTLFK